MNKGTLICVGAIVLVGLLFVVPMLTYSGLPHGYSGLVGGVSGVDHDYTDNRNGVEVDYFQDWYYTGINPPNYFPWVPGDPTGIKTSITSPQYVKHEDYETIIWEDPEIYVNPDTGAQEIRTVETQVSLVTFEFTIFIETYPEGNQAIENVVFWYRLQNNPYTVFQGADTTAIATISVRTSEINYLSVGDNYNSEPSAGGADFSIHTFEYEGRAGQGQIVNFPVGVEEYYNVANLRKFQDIEFPLVINIAEPVSWLFDRKDVLVEYTCVAEVVLFGEWEQMRPYVEVIPPPVDVPWWEALFNALGGVFDFFGGIVAAIVVIVGVIGTVVVVTRTKGGIMVFGVIIVWVAVIFVLALIGFSVVDMV